MPEQQSLVKQEQAEVVVQDEPTSILAVIARAAADPRVDPVKMQALLDMQIRVEERQAEIEFNQAMARLLPKLPRIEKDGIIRNKDKSIRSRFSKYETIDAVIRPLLAEEGLAFSFDVDDSVPRHVKVIGTLSHRLGHSRQSRITMPIDNPVITGGQAVAAARSLAKRCIVIDMLNLVTVGEDTDGVSVETITPEQAMTIETLLADTKADVKKFLDWAHVSRIEEILAKDYRAVMKALEAKRRG